MRDPILREAKSTLRQWFREQSMEYCVRVTDESRRGRFQYKNPDCCIRGLCSGGFELATSDEAKAAEAALYALGGGETVLHGDCIELERRDAFSPSHNYLGRVRTLPIVLAEVRRRNRAMVTEPAKVRA